MKYIYRKRMKTHTREIYLLTLALQFIACFIYINQLDNMILGSFK